MFGILRRESRNGFIEKENFSPANEVEAGIQP